jgi:hypothetical protein
VLTSYGDEKVANREIRVWHGATKKRRLNDGQIQNPSNPFGIVPLSNFAPRGFGFVHHSMANPSFLYHEVPKPHLTIRGFSIAAPPSPRPRRRNERNGGTHDDRCPLLRDCTTSVSRVRSLLLLPPGGVTALLLSRGSGRCCSGAAVCGLIDLRATTHTAALLSQLLGLPVNLGSQGLLGSYQLYVDYPYEF